MSASAPIALHIQALSGLLENAKNNAIADFVQSGNLRTKSGAAPALTPDPRGQIQDTKLPLQSRARSASVGDAIGSQIVL